MDHFKDAVEVNLERLYLQLQVFVDKLPLVMMAEELIGPVWPFLEEPNDIHLDLPDHLLILLFRILL